jgi:hypothetical protein
MKKLTVLLSLLFAASLTYAGDATSEAKEAGKHAGAAAKEAKSEAKEAGKDAKDAMKDAKAAAKSEAKGKTHEVEAEVVSVDNVKNTITIKGEKGEQTAPLEGKAIADAKTVKAGQKVTLVCHDDDAGAHKAVTGIKTGAATSEKK